MGREKQYTKDIVLEAIYGSGAIIGTVAARLDCAWHTAKKYIYKWEETKIAFSDEAEGVLDMCESAVYTSVRKGNTKDAKWVLATRGQSRGFGRGQSETSEQMIEGFRQIMQAFLQGDDDDE